MTVWLDIDDLLAHLAWYGRPSGIQRVVYEAGAALRRVGGDKVQFLRRGHGPFDFRIVHWQAVEQVFRSAMQGRAGPGSASPRGIGRMPGDGSEPPARDPARDPAHDPAHDLVLAQARAVLAIGGLAVGAGRLLRRHGLRGGRSLAVRIRALVRPVGPQVPVAVAGEAFADGAAFAGLVRADDVFLTLGAPWHHEDYVRTVRWLRDGMRVRFGLLVHDLIPLRHPEWCDRGVIASFRAWHRALLPLADAMLTLSRATARDLGCHLVEQGIAGNDRISSVPPGTVCSLSATIPAPVPVVEGPFVLFVSTLEARKNHVLLFRVWRRLLAELPRAQVPTLVFAGREGWLVSDLMQQLENSDWLGGRIRFVRNPTDAELHRLYADCLFTVFPSLFEGWGLPVTESLGMGKPCVASNTTSIREAGGSLARYFNPYDGGDAYGVIRDAILDREGLARWTAEVRSGFRPTSWDASARTMLRILG